MRVLLASSSWRTATTGEEKQALSLREPAKRHLPCGLSAAERRLRPGSLLAGSRSERQSQ